MSRIEPRESVHRRAPARSYAPAPSAPPAPPSDRPADSVSSGAGAPDPLREAIAGANPQARTGELSAAPARSKTSPSLDEVASGRAYLRAGQRDLLGGEQSIHALQTMLNKAGATPSLAVNGVFDSATKDGVRDYQHTRRLDVDGVVGEDTLESLRAPDYATIQSEPGYLRLSDASKAEVRMYLDPAAAPEPSRRKQVADLVLSDGFAMLNDQHRAMMLEASFQSADGSMATEQLQVLAGSPAFRNLNDAVKSTAIEHMGRALDDAELQATMDLATSPGFGLLADTEKTKLLQYCGGENPQISGQAREKLKVLLADPNYQAKTPAEQMTELRKFLTEQPREDRVLTARNGELDAVLGAYTISAPTEVKDHDFRSGTGDALRYDVTIDGQTIPVYVSKTPPADKYSHTVEQAAKGLADLPPPSRGAVTRVDLGYGPNPTAPAGDPSYMTAGSAGIITFYPTEHEQDQQDLEGALIHETGHALSMKAWGDQTSDARWDPWRAAMQSDAITPSPYGQTDEREDFAESLKLYYMVKGTKDEDEIRALMPERFKLIEAMSP